MEQLGICGVLQGKREYGGGFVRAFERAGCSLTQQV